MVSWAARERWNVGMMESRITTLPTLHRLIIPPFQHSIIPSSSHQTFDRFLQLSNSIASFRARDHNLILRQSQLFSQLALSRTAFTGGKLVAFRERGEH